jgi:hypothetical protein
VAVEVFGRTHFVLDDRKPLFKAEMKDLAKPIEPKKETAAKLTRATSARGYDQVVCRRQPDSGPVGRSRRTAMHSELGFAVLCNSGD